MFKKNTAIVPVLRINNRAVNLTFFEDHLGMRNKLEEGPFAELGDSLHSEVKLVLMESPGTRTRAVRGTKKLNKIVIKVDNAPEIETLLAQGTPFSRLYRGQKGYGFEAVSPEGDCFLLHAEDSVVDLKEILPPVLFTAQKDFSGLTTFTVESIWINTPQPSTSQAFYQAILPNQTFLRFVQAEGVDLLAPAEQVWDLDSVRFPVEQSFAWTDLESRLMGSFFKDRKETFIQTVDPSGIECWFEK